jgi:hypothetical protein
MTNGPLSFRLRERNGRNPLTFNTPPNSAEAFPDIRRANIAHIDYNDVTDQLMMCGPLSLDTPAPLGLPRMPSSGTSSKCLASNLGFLLTATINASGALAPGGTITLKRGIADLGIANAEVIERHQCVALAGRLRSSDEDRHDCRSACLMGLRQPSHCTCTALDDQSSQ